MSQGGCNRRSPPLHPGSTSSLNQTDYNSGERVPFTASWWFYWSRSLQRTRRKSPLHYIQVVIWVMRAMTDTWWRRPCCWVVLLVKRAATDAWWKKALDHIQVVLLVTRALTHTWWKSHLHCIWVVLLGCNRRFIIESPAPYPGSTFSHDRHLVSEFLPLHLGGTTGQRDCNRRLIIEFPPLHPGGKFSHEGSDRYVVKESSLLHPGSSTGQEGCDRRLMKEFPPLHLGDEFSHERYERHLFSLYIWVVLSTTSG